MKKLVDVITVISGTMTILDVGWKFYTEAQIQISTMGTIFLILCITSIVFRKILSKPRCWHDLFKYISYTTHKRNYSYIIKEKNVKYIYIDRINLQHRKTNTIISCTNDLASFTDSFRWSKPQSIDQYTVECQSEHTNLILNRRDIWMEYTVEFSPPPKGAERTIDVLIAPLYDPQKEALPFLSSSISQVIKKLKMSVIFGNNVTAANFQYLIFNNASAKNPIFEEMYDPNGKNECIKYNSVTNTIEVEEKYPIYGYKYKIQWQIDDKIEKV